MHFIGRKNELSALDKLYQTQEGRLVVIYGRRRIGKSRLIEQFIRGKKYFRFEGLENARTKAQIGQFMGDFGLQLKNPLLKETSINSWIPVLDYLTQFFSEHQEKYILFLDEFQWLCANQSKLVSLIKKYWDLHWQHSGVMLILCGSVASFMTKRVIASKALYGRIHLEICLQPFNPKEAFQCLAGKRSADEVLQYLLVFGGIPKYLQEIDAHRSLAQNINDLFFTEHSVLSRDYEKIFYSQFKEHKIYEQIVHLLKEKPKTLEEIAQHLKIASGGGMKSYLENLEKALFITSYVPYDKTQKSKLKKYKLTDEYLRFYFRFIEPHLQLIASNRNRNLFTHLVKPAWDTWLGFAFENFCLKNAFYLSELMGFSDQVIQWGPYFHRKDQHFQIDLLYLRSDRVVTLCEIKYTHQPVSIQVIHEVEKKCRGLLLPPGYTLERALISRFGPDKALKEADYFHHLIDVDGFFDQ